MRGWPCGVCVIGPGARAGWRIVGAGQRWAAAVASESESESVASPLVRSDDTDDAGCWAASAVVVVGDMRCAGRHAAKRWRGFSFDFSHFSEGDEGGIWKMVGAESQRERDVTRRGYDEQTTMLSLAFNLLPTRIIITITNPASIIGRNKAGGRPKTDTMARPLLCSFLLRHAFSAPGSTARAGIQQPGGRWG